MKTKLLTLLLSVLTYCTVFGQSLTGEPNPCPGIDYNYSITVPTSAGIPYVTNLSNGFQSADMVPTQTGTNVTYKYTIRWNNYYQTSNGAPVKSVFEVTTPAMGTTPAKPYPIQVTIKGLSDVQFSSVPDPSCAYRGNITVSVSPVANATRYVWTNSAGWGGNVTTTTASNVFNVTNESTATITVVAYNDNCTAANPVSKTNSTTVTRPAVAIVPAFTAAPAQLCSANVLAASVSVAEGTPVSYEWYTAPANYIGLNSGGSYSATAPLVTTTPTVNMSYIGPATGGQPTTLYCRAVYSATCKTAYNYYTLSTGKPAVQMFAAFTATLGEVFGDSFGACPIEVLQIRPVTNYGTGAVTGHQWEMLSGSYSSVSNLTGIPLRLRMSSQLNAEVEFRYRFNTACGWSDWLNCYAFTWSCNGARTAVITEKTAAAPTNPLSFTLSPNPAANEISVNIPDTKSNTALLLNIVDIKGTSLIRSKHAAASKVTVDISKLPAGQYILQVQSGTNSYSKQFIIAK